MQNLSVCVFCGSRFGLNPEYEHAAKSLGIGLGERNWRLVYGAGDVGLMGSLARSAQAAGAAILGVIPTHLIPKEVAMKDLTNLIVTENMHERKKIMFMNSEAIILLPGGIGSLDEFFEVLTWVQLGLHEKPIVLVNVSNYWDRLLSLIEQMCSEGFADPSISNALSVVENVESALDIIESRCEIKYY